MQFEVRYGSSTNSTYGKGGVTFFIIRLPYKYENRRNFYEIQSKTACKPLEDNNGLTLAEGASTSQICGCGTVLDVTTHWNKDGKYHASVNNADSLFKTTAFTILLDVR